MGSLWTTEMERKGVPVFQIHWGRRVTSFKLSGLAWKDVMHGFFATAFFTQAHTTCNWTMNKQVKVGQGVILPISRFEIPDTKHKKNESRK